LALVAVVNTTTQPQATERAFISLQEAAQEIGCTRRFLERRIEDGEFAVFRPSRRLVRVARGELNRWVESYSHGRAKEPMEQSEAARVA
jgi:excisionase family DNA binding protein